MASFTNRFTGQGLQPAEVLYRAIVLDVSKVSFWPAFAGDNTVLAGLVDISATSAFLTLSLPDARQAAPGASSLLRNTGIYNITVNDFAGNVIGSLIPGQQKFFYLTNVVAAAGVWATVTYGVGLGALDAAAAAGFGLKALGSTLNVAESVASVNASRTITANDLSNVIVWVGGAGVLTLPLAATLAPFNLEVRNQGSGVLTLQPSGGELFDGSALATFNVGESARISAGVANWYTVGRGRNALFNFTQLQKTVTGGTTVLSLTEAANVVQTYLGALGSNQDVVLPAVVQVYYVSNQTTGAFNLRVKNPGSGTTVSIPAGQNAVLFSDGTNIVNASTTVAGISSIVFSAGSAAATPVGVGSSNTGLFASAVAELAVSSSGTQVAIFDALGLRVTPGTNMRVNVESSAGTAVSRLQRPAGQEGSTDYATAAALRWRTLVNGVTEGGSNAGSNFEIRRYSDAGAYIDSPILIDRASGVTVFSKASRDVGSIGQLSYFPGAAPSPAFWLKANGVLLSRATYPELFAYASASGLVSEAVWTAGQWGRFSVGDGTTTFRIPDVRGVTIRSWDDGRGIDAGRNWGEYQSGQLPSHSHGINDPGHSHGVNDPSHVHGVYDPGHAHGISDPGHAHTIYSVMQGNGGVSPSGFGFNVYVPGNNTSAAAGTGISINGNGTGVGLYGAATGISLATGYTSISTQAAGVGTEVRVPNISFAGFIRY